MIRHYKLDENREPVPVEDIFEWAEWFEKSQSERVVRCTDVAKDVTVSTVFLGLDHQFAPGGLPLLYESLVFGGPLNDEMKRYSTEAEAISGHEALVQMSGALVDIATCAQRALQQSPTDHKPNDKPEEDIQSGTDQSRS